MKYYRLYYPIKYAVVQEYKTKTFYKVVTFQKGPSIKYVTLEGRRSEKV